MHEEWEIRSLPREENLERAWRNLWGLRFEWDVRVWERKQRAIERDIEWNEDRIAWGGLNRTFNKARQMRCWEVSRKLLRYVLRKCLWTAEVSSKYRAIRNQIQKQKLDRSTRCQEAIKEAGAFSIDPPSIEELLGLWYEKGLRSSIDSKVSRRSQATFKNQFFVKRKTHSWMQSNMQLNQWSNQHSNLSKLSLN